MEAICATLNGALLLGHGAVVALRRWSASASVLPRVEVYGQNELLATVQNDQAKASLLGRFLPDDAGAKQELATIQYGL